MFAYITLHTSLATSKQNTDFSVMQFLRLTVNEQRDLLHWKQKSKNKEINKFTELIP